MSDLPFPDGLSYTYVRFVYLLGIKVKRAFYLACSW